MYKDKGKQKEAVRKAVNKHRKGITVHTTVGEMNPVSDGICRTFDVDFTKPYVIPCNTQDYPSVDQGWADVREYISRGDNLERLQRICGSLGKNAHWVWFGVSGITCEDIGKVIGTMEGKYAR